MTKDEILEYFKDINHAYNDCTRYDTLKRMLDELQEPCEDAISRQAVLDLPKNTERGFGGKILEQSINIEYIKALPPVTPQYTDTEIQKMQDLESVEIQTAYEIGKAEGSEVLDKIRVEIDEQYDRVHPYNISCAEGLEMALDIIDKYKASPTGAESEDKE